MDIQYAINRLASCSIIPFDADAREVCDMAIKALQEKAEREKGCEYCDPKNVDYYYAGNVPNYCKHCGRKLNDRC